MDSIRQDLIKQIEKQRRDIQKTYRIELAKLQYWVGEMFMENDPLYSYENESGITVPLHVRHAVRDFQAKSVRQIIEEA